MGNYGDLGLFSGIPEKDIIWASVKPLITRPAGRMLFQYGITGASVRKTSLNRRRFDKGGGGGWVSLNVWIQM
jgi:hypothetical protein